MQQQKQDGAEDEKDYVDELKPGTKLLQGQYTIDSFLNSGGFGITYLAKDSLDRRIVIKECFPGSFCRRSQAIVAARSRAHQNEFRSVVKLFMQEARSLAKLVHPNIVGVHQVFEDNETAYMAIDYVDGRDLLELIEDPASSFKPDEIVDMTKKLLSAVAFIHENDVLHRDISPDNILIHKKDGEPILIDFGAAREQATKASRALSALRVVKDGYSPQEFYVAGSQQGPWSDLYALAASLYHLIKDEAPINSQVRLAAVAEGRGDPYQPLAGTIDGYPEGFLEAIDKAMQTVPARRIQLAQEWLDMFQKPGASEKVVPLNVEKAAAKPAAPKAAAAPAAAAPAAKPAEAANSGGGKKMVLMGTAAAIAVLAGIGVFLMGGSDDPVEVAEEPAVLSTPAPVETAAAPASAPATPAPTTTAAAPAPVAPAPAPTTTRPATTAPTTTASRTSSAPTTSRTSGGSTSFADIISSRPATTTARPTTVAPRTATVPTTTTTTRTTTPTATATAPTTTRSSNSGTSFSDIIASRRATATARPSAVEPRTTTRAAIAPNTTTAPRTTTTTTTTTTTAPSRTTTTPSRTSTGGNNNSFTDFLAAQTRTATPSTPQRATTARAAAAATGLAIDTSAWSVSTPFEFGLTRRNGAIVALVTSVSNSSAGEWLEKDVEIHRINGKAIDVSADVTNVFETNATAGSDGLITATLTVKTKGADSTSEKTISLAGTRTIELSNGLELETSKVDGAWVTKVIKTGADASGLQAGDVLLNERSTGTAIDNADAIDKVLGELKSNNTRIAQFDVTRGGSRAVANLTLN